MGDGTTVTCRGPGTPYRESRDDPRRPSLTCGHTYLESSADVPNAELCEERDPEAALDVLQRIIVLDPDRERGGAASSACGSISAAVTMPGARRPFWRST
ncbi:hypothetical protein Pta02_47740 [Planobispora takensis]|uniref:Uncharacterized protein n=2 Tax=Planobispora takensis TaxID=1367882 RepID=A0A8J3SZU4_9ACTN|nr:hypothetical protein Pta02_47740 [Planobispora takensis]